MAQQDNELTAATEVEELRQRVAELEGRSTRRNMLRLAGAAVVGGVAASVAGAQPAAATTGAMQYGATNSAGIDGTFLTATLGESALDVTNSDVDGTAIRGRATADGTGLRGTITSPEDNAYGVWGESNGSVGYGVVGSGGAAQMCLTPFGSFGLPSTGFHLGGELLANSTGLHYCVTGDRSGVGTWRTLADVNSAGAFFPISPARVYDSRAAAPTPGKLAAGAHRTVYCGDKRNAAGAVILSNVVPHGATAIAFNLTVVGTIGTNGFLAVNEGYNSSAASSLINWSSAGLTTANSSVVKLNGSRQIEVVCGGTSTNCHFIIDVLGYYR